MISFSNKCATYYVTAPVNRRRVCRASSNSSSGSAGSAGGGAGAGSDGGVIIAALRTGAAATSACCTTATGELITAEPSAAVTAPGAAQPASNAWPSSKARVRKGRHAKRSALVGGWAAVGAG